MAPGYTQAKLQFAARLKASRNAAHISQERAAALVGTSRRHWIRWESGETSPNPAYLERIAEVLDDPSLLPDDEEEEAAQMPLARDLGEALIAVVREQIAVAVREVTR